MSKKPFRTMKENALEEEVYQIRKMRGQVDPVEEYRRKLVLEFLGSSEVTKAILEKNGYTFSGEAKPMSYFDNKIKLLTDFGLRMPSENKRCLEEKAKRVATEAHQYQFRKDNITPAIYHPRNVVNYLKQIGIKNKNVICAAWLHDTVEDTPLTLDYIRKEFNPEITSLVKKLTKNSDREDYKKIIKNSDYNVQIIKLADTLDNCSNLSDSYLPKDLVKRKVDDCKTFYLPMAERVCPQFYSMLIDRIDGINGFSKKEWENKRR